MKIEKTNYNKFDCGQKGNLRTRKKEEDFFMELKVVSGTIFFGNCGTDMFIELLIGDNLYVNERCECYQIMEKEDED